MNMANRIETLWLLALVFMFHNVLLAVAFTSTTKEDFGTVTRRGRSHLQMAEENKPWDVFQFARQSSRFVSFFPGQTATKRQVIQPGDVLYKAGDSNNDFTFAPLDDVVMGGASSSSFDDATGQWRGQVTDANNGGFIGIRSTPSMEWDMSSCKGIELKVSCNKDSGNKNSKNRIKVVVRDSTEFNGIGWTSSADVTSSGTGAQSGMNSVKVSLTNQIPTRFAKVVPGSQTFSKDHVKSIQLVYSKFEYDGDLNPTFAVGDFQLQVVEIRAF